MTLYEILGIKEGATVAQIKAAYRKKSTLYHPDKVKGMENKFQEVSDAYKVLSDEHRRARYDRTGRIDDVKVTPDVVQGMVRTTVMAMVMAERPDGSSDDPTWDDIRSKVIMSIQAGRRDAVANVKRNEKHIKRLDNLAKRFKSKTDEDPVGDAFAEHRRSLVAELNKWQDALELSHKTEEVFASYQYHMGEMGTEPEGQFSPAPTRRLSGLRYITAR